MDIDKIILKESFEELWYLLTSFKDLTVVGIIFYILLYPALLIYGILFSILTLLDYFVNKYCFKEE